MPLIYIKFLLKTANVKKFSFFFLQNKRSHNDEKYRKTIKITHFEIHSFIKGKLNQLPGYFLCFLKIPNFWHWLFDKNPLIYQFLILTLLNWKTRMKSIVMHHWNFTFSWIQKFATWAVHLCPNICYIRKPKWSA